MLSQDLHRELVTADTHTSFHRRGCGCGVYVGSCMDIHSTLAWRHRLQAQETNISRHFLGSLWKSSYEVLLAHGPVTMMMCRILESWSLMMMATSSTGLRIRMIDPHLRIHCQKILLMSTLILMKVLIVIVLIVIAHSSLSLRSLESRL